MKEGEGKEEGEEEEEEDAEEVFQCTLASPSASSRPRGALCHGARAASEVMAGAKPAEAGGTSEGLGSAEAGSPEGLGSDETRARAILLLFPPAPPARCTNIYP